MKKLDRIEPSQLSGNPRATLQAWLKYESIILAAFKQHPQPYIFRPSNMAASTVSSRARDAVRGKLAFDYPCSTPDAPSNQELAKWYEEVVFKNDKEQVYIGPVDGVKQTLQGTALASRDSAGKTLVFDTLTFEEVSAFSLLLSTGRISGPVLIKSPPDLSLLPQRDNVERVERPDGLVLI